MRELPDRWVGDVATAPRFSFLQFVSRWVINRTFREMNANPWEVNTRSGVVRIDGEPIVLPRTWLLAADNDSYLKRVLRDAWNACTRHPLRLVDCHEKLICWDIKLDIVREEGDDDGSLQVEHWPDHLPSLPETFEWSELPPLVPSMVQAALHSVLTDAFSDAERYLHADDPLMEELVGGIVRRLESVIDIRTLFDAVIVVKTHFEDEISLARERFINNAVLVAAARDVLAWQWRCAEALPPADRKLAHLAHLVAEPAAERPVPTADELRHWLTQAGISRNALQRLRYLPDAAWGAIITHWELNERSCWRAPVVWLGHLLSLLHAQRDSPIDEGRLKLLGHITAVAGLTAIGNVARNDHHDDNGAPGQFRIAPSCCDLLLDEYSFLVWDISPGNHLLADRLTHALLAEIITASPEELASLHEQINGIHDWLRAVTGIDRPRGAKPLRQIASRWSDFVRAQARWHEQLADEQRARYSQYLPTTPVVWHVPSEIVVAGNHVAVPLRSSDDLRGEGEALSHCVATYWQRCQDGECVIYSIRQTADGQRLGTLELHWILRGWRVIQFRGLRNAQCLTPDGDPREEFVPIVNALMACLATAPWPPNQPSPPPCDTACRMPA